MSIGLSIDSLEESFSSREDYVISMSRWFGRDLSWNDLPELQSHVERRIVELLCGENHQSDLLAFKLAWIGSSSEQHPIIERDIAHLIRTSDEWEIHQVGLGKSFSKGCKHAWDKTCEVASDTWKATCEVATKTCETVKEFWEEHKQEIIIGTVIVATGIAVAATIVYTGGVGTQAAVAGGAALVQSLANDSEEKSEPNSADLLSNAPPVSTNSPQPAPGGVSLEEDFSLSQLEIIEKITFYPAVQFPDLSPPVEQIQTLLPITPSPFELPPVLEKPLYPQLTLEALYGEDHVSRLYEQFQLPDPYPATSETPRENTPVTSPQPSYNRQFVELVEAKLKETRESDYLDKLMATDSGRPYNQEFVELVEKRLLEVYEPNYMATLQTIQTLFPQREFALKDNYASSLSLQKPSGPYREVPLLGHHDQSTIHFHCGVNNTFSSIVEGGLCLNNSLDKQFAVQPHLVHSNSLLRGLTFVGLEKVDGALERLSAAGVNGNIPGSLEWPGQILQHSQIQKSIDYEVESLSKIAQNIIEKGNPKLKQVHVTFSNGGYVFNEALKQLPPEYRETIIVVTTGTTAIIDDRLACKVYNVIGDKDWPSKACNGADSGIAAAKDKDATIYTIPQNETQGVLGGHYFMQPDYQRQISELLKKEVVSEYEIY